MSKCKIVLENDHGTYLPGYIIEGKLECYFENKIGVRGIISFFLISVCVVYIYFGLVVKVWLKCEENNEWTGRSGKYTTTLTGKNDLLCIEKNLFTPDSSKQILNSGSYIYPFSYTLPLDIPSTFDGKYGSIRYKIMALVNTTSRSNSEDQYVFTVESPIDFNTLPQILQRPMTYSHKESVRLLCFKIGYVTMDVQLPKTAFTPGEVINFTVNVCNNSNEYINGLKVKLKKITTYKVASKRYEIKSKDDEIFESKHNGLGAHDERIYNLQLKIPETTLVPNFTNCTLFKVEYCLKVSCLMPAMMRNLDIYIYDVQLGHIICDDYVEQQNEGQGLVNIGFVNLPPVDGMYLRNTNASTNDGNFSRIDTSVSPYVGRDFPVSTTVSLDPPPSYEDLTMMEVLYKPSAPVELPPPHYIRK